MSPITYSGASWTSVASFSRGAVSGCSRPSTCSTSNECCATEKAWSPVVWPFQRATRARPCAMSSTSTSSGDGSRRLRRRPDSMRCQARGGAPALSGTSILPAGGRGGPSVGGPAWQGDGNVSRTGTERSTFVERGAEPVEAGDAEGLAASRRAEPADYLLCGEDVGAGLGQRALCLNGDDSAAGGAAMAHAAHHLLADIAALVESH